MAKLEVTLGDITRLAVDAIVNAANAALAGGGGGVDGAIHRAAGPELLRASLALGGCPTGDAKATPGFNLPAKWVFHAVGPVWHGGSHGEDDALASCYRRCLALALAHSVETIAFPAISTGIYGFPHRRAAVIATRTVQEWLTHSDPTHRIYRVLFCCFSRETAALYNELLTEASRG